MTRYSTELSEVYVRNHGIALLYLLLKSSTFFGVRYPVQTAVLEIYQFNLKKNRSIGR